mgnify:CR=1 FL=1
MRRKFNTHLPVKEETEAVFTSLVFAGLLPDTVSGICVPLVFWR